MNEVGLVLALLFALVLLALFGGLRWVIARLPMPKPRRAMLARVRPVLEAALAGLYLLIAFPLVFEGYAAYTPVVLALGLVGVSWFAIRDFVAGVFLKAGELCEVGDHVDLDGRTGTVEHLGYRVLTLRDEGGAEVFIPYGQISSRSLVRTRRSEGLHPHSFELSLPGGADPVTTLVRIKGLAMSSHWASIVREPELEPLTSERVRVRVFALGREHGPAIEAHVRRSL